MNMRRSPHRPFRVNIPTVASLCSDGLKVLWSGWQLHGRMGGNITMDYGVNPRSRTPCQCDFAKKLAGPSGNFAWNTHMWNGWSV